MADRDACPMALAMPYFGDDELPYVVLFATALELEDRLARLAAVARLAVAYRELFT